MAQNHLIQVTPSAANIVGTISKTITAIDSNGLLLVVDITVPNGGTVTPNIKISGDAGIATFTPVVLWQGPGLVAGAVSLFYFYPQGLEGNAGFTSLTERHSISMPSQYQINLVTTVATVTYSAAAYLLT